MNDNKNRTFEPATIENLKQRGYRLGVHCHQCARFKYVSMDHFKDQDPVPTLVKKYRFSPCSRCGSRDLQARPVQSIHPGEWAKETDDYDGRRTLND